MKYTTGYREIDLKGANLNSVSGGPVNVPGIYAAIESSPRAILMTNLLIDDIDIKPIFVSPIPFEGTFTFFVKFVGTENPKLLYVNVDPTDNVWASDIAITPVSPITTIDFNSVVLTDGGEAVTIPGIASKIGAAYDSSALLLKHVKVGSRILEPFICTVKVGLDPYTATRTFELTTVYHSDPYGAIGYPTEAAVYTLTLYCDEDDKVRIYKNLIEIEE